MAEDGNQRTQIASDSDLYDMCIGSGALTYEWWAVDSTLLIDDNGNAHHGWQMEVSFGVEDEGDIIEAILDGPRLWAAILACSTGQVAGVSVATREECNTARFHPDMADFDAAIADEIMQVAVCGTAIYG